nr:signal peptide peptidase SppA [Sphingobium boeckii]
MLVAIKDGLVLLLMLLFFAGLYSLLSGRPNPVAIPGGALLVSLDGSLVEQPQEADPVAALLGNSPVMREHRLRDVVHALETAATDSRIKVVVLDLDKFAGGGQAAIARAAEAVDKVRAAKKPVLAYATGYSDDSYQLAAHASEIWLDPFGMTLFTGPGGSRLYYKGLIDKLGVTTHVYRVGTYKSFVEPYTRTDQSPEAKQADQALSGALWQNWQDMVAATRPKAQLASFIARPQEKILAAGGDMAKAALDAGLVDKLGDRTAFGQRLAEIVGPEAGKPVGSFAHTNLDAWVAANPLPSAGPAIGVITVAGEIVDGEAKPGTAGGDTIAKLLLEGLSQKNLKALVVRVDSPGGSVLASEKIRQAILQAKAAGLPIVVSMGSVAASGGYWVSTPADRIFAEPSTVTGSIGVFGIIPSFENALGKVGVTTDGVKTTPLSGQPDILGGTSPEFDALIQSSIENVYARFIALVGQSRKMPVAKVDQIAQGRVWDGGTARQIGLVDQFGSIEDAIADAAKRAKLDPAKVHAEYLDQKPSLTASFLKSWTDRNRDGDEQQGSADLISRLSQQRTLALFQAVQDAQGLAQGPALRVQCLECPKTGVNMTNSSKGVFAQLVAWLAR